MAKLSCEELKQIVADPDNKIQGISKVDFFKQIYRFTQNGLDPNISGTVFFNQQELTELRQTIPNTIFNFKLAESDGSRDEAILLAEKMKSAGFKVMYSIVRGAEHDFPFLSSILGGFNPNYNGATLDWVQEIKAILDWSPTY